MNVKKQFFDGLINQNPSLVQLLGMCPLLAITTSMFNGLGMGLAVTIILTCSNVVISALRKIIPNKVRIACYIVVIAGFGDLTFAQTLTSHPLCSNDEEEQPVEGYGKGDYVAVTARKCVKP